MEEIRKQETHDLYCPKCTCNITKTAQLVEKGDDFSPDNQKPFVLWIPIFTPFKFLSSSPTGSVESNPSSPNHSVIPVENNPSYPNPSPSGPHENNSYQPDSTEPVDNISSNSNSNGRPVEENSSNPYSSGSGNINSSNPSLSHLAKILERLPTRFRNSIILREENNNATPLHQDGACHQSSTSTSVSEQHGRGKTCDVGWLVHRPI
ncbi:unnamed protein product [Arabidopsis lyrata]|nr:unnamed protein product [Arabidopsis lyrata]